MYIIMLYIWVVICCFSTDTHIHPRSVKGFVWPIHIHVCIYVYIVMAKIGPHMSSGCSKTVYTSICVYNCMCQQIYYEVAITLQRDSNNAIHQTQDSVQALPLILRTSKFSSHLDASDDERGSVCERGGRIEGSWKAHGCIREVCCV